MAGQVELGLASRLVSIYPTLCWKLNWIPVKISVLPSGILSQTLDLANFTAAQQSSHSVVNLAWQRCMLCVINWSVELGKWVFFYGVAYQKSRSAVFMFPEKGVPSAVVGTVHRWCRDYAAGLTGEVPRLQKFCRRNCWVFAASRQQHWSMLLLVSYYMKN